MFSSFTEDSWGGVASGLLLAGEHSALTEAGLLSNLMTE